VKRKIRKEKFLNEICLKCKRGKPATLSGIGKSNSDIMVVEEQPVNLKRLSRHFLKIGISPDKIYFTSAVKCISKGKITDRQIKMCSGFLADEFENKNPKVIIIMGTASVKAVLGKTGGVNKFRGYIIPFHKRNCHAIVTYNLEQIKIDYLYDVFIRDIRLVRIALNQRYVSYQDYAECNEVLTTTPKITHLINTIVEKKEPFALDWETKGLKPYNNGNHIISCGIALSNKQSYSFLVESADVEYNEKVQEALIRLLESDCPKIFFNYKFEKLWGKERLNIDIKNNVFDVMFLAYILNETRGTHNLDHLSFVYFGLQKLKEADKYKEDMTQCPLDLLHKYNGLDAKLTFALYEELKPRLDKQDWKVYDMLLSGAEATLKSEMEGAIIDKEILEKNKQKVLKQKTESNISLLHSDEVIEFERQEGKQINLNSTQQISKVIFGILKLNGVKKTGTGAKSCDAEVLEGFSDIPFCKNLLQYRRATKLYSTYLKGFEKNIYDDGLLHTNYNLTFTETGRLSSDSPNLQNFPKHDNAFIREMFAVPENHVLMSFDYKGAELRVLAMESKDRELIKQINNGYDMHIEWAGRLEQAINREVSKHEGKNSFVFPTVYGSSYKSIAKNMGVDEALIEKVQREFFKMFPSIKRWQHKLQMFYKKHHFVQSLLGRKRHAPLDYNQVINTPIQSLASDFCLLSMIRASREGYKVPLIIHDDITLYVPRSEIIKTYRRIKKIMTQWDYDFINVNLEVECSIGLNWFNQKPLEELIKI